MTLELILRYLHFVSIFAIVGTLSIESILLKKELSKGAIHFLSRIDAVYGFAALTLLTAGLTLWLGGYGKPTIYYSQNWIFLFKVGLFAVIGLLSIYPTVFFLKNRKGNPDEPVIIPNKIFWMVRLELIILFLIPLLAGLMARGIGFFG
jgi:putative membrane protein